jgi:hypothetical protein
VTFRRPWYNQHVLPAQPAQPLMPIIVKVVAAPAKEINVADVLMGSVGITGLFLLGAALLGFLLGAALIVFRRWQDARGADVHESDVFQLTQPPRSHP